MGDTFVLADTFVGALSMIGLAFVARLLVRLIKGKEQEVPVP